MSQTELFIIKGMIASLPEEDQKKVFECADAINLTIDQFGDMGIMAMALVGLMRSTA